MILDDHHLRIKGNRQKEMKRNKMKLKSPSNTCCLTSYVCLVFIIILYMTSLCLAVTVHEVKLLSDSGKSDYVLSGEGVTLSCLFLIDPAEEVISLEWIRDTNNSIYLWRNIKNTVPYVSPLIRNHLNNTYNNSTSSFSLHLTNTSINLHGSYSCQLTSSKGTSSNEVFVIVIQDSNCQESAFNTHSDLVSCTEDVTFYCRGFFPKPSPVCGLYSDFTGSYIQSIPFDRIERQEEDGTYEVSLFRRFHAKDWIQFKKHKLSFRCFIIVMSTTWRRGIHHKLFGPVGCPDDPPNVRSGHYNLSRSEGETCWQTPKEGTKIKYSCDTGFDLLGPESLVCSPDGLWKESNNKVRDQFGERRTVCSKYTFLLFSCPLLQITLGL